MVRRKKKIKRRKKITFTCVNDNTIENVEEQQTVETTKPLQQQQSKLPTSWHYQDMVTELYQFLMKHKPETWGDALGIIHAWEREDNYELLYETTGGQEHHSNFMRDLLWNISTHGPTNKIEYQG